MEKEKKYSVYKIIMIVCTAVFLTFMITSLSLYTYFVKNPDTLSSKNNDIISSIEKYRDLIDKYYLGEIDEEKVKEGAIRGYIDGLGDPYTEYISKDEMKSYIEDTMGNFVGIGIYMVKNTEKDRIQVLSTIKGSPAEEVGIQAGDLILDVDGIDYRADDMDVASRNIKGEEGTKVKIQLLRGTEKVEYEITRKKIKINQVEGKILNNDIGYIQFSSFDETTADDFENEFEKLKIQGIKALIIDLRDNGGGIVT